MIVDSSAVVATLKAEPGHERVLQILTEAQRPAISAGTLLELSIVVDRLGDPALSRRLDDLMVALGLVVEPWTARQAQIGRDAYRDFGRGSGHRANLNFGDCFAYALARDRGEPLLFVGDDFSHTDLTPALVT